MDEALKPRRVVQEMSAYSLPSPEREHKLRLDFNENTQGCSSKVVNALQTAISAVHLTVYPEYAVAATCLARHFGVSEGEMLFTNGTDEAIQVLLNTFVEPTDEITILHPSYAIYRIYAELSGAKIRVVSYHESTLAFPLEELIASINPETKAILISNPNNPTGSAASRDAIEQVLHHASHAAVLIDEAYFEFCGITALPLIQRFSNLFVSRSFSKAHGLAGIRFGCLFSDARNLAFARKVRLPYSVNSLATIAARTAVDDRDHLAKYVAEVLAAREFLYVELERLGIPFYRSEGNFVLVRLGARSSEICTQLGMAGVLVRDRSYELPGCVRITIGTREQVAHFIEELERLYVNRLVR